MRRLFVSPGQLASAQDGVLRLAPEQARYLALVLRLRDGDEVALFDGRGATVSARLQQAAAGEPSLLLGARVQDAAPTGELWLAQALSRGDKLDLVVQKATELGVARVIPFAAERSVVKLDEGRAASRRERLQRIAQEAARQCGRSDVPEISAPARWEDLFALLRTEPAPQGLLLDTASGTPGLGQVAHGERLLVAVGPEGGFSPDELSRAVDSGFTRASLGRLTLRTETAGLAALAVLQYVRGELG